MLPSSQEQASPDFGFGQGLIQRRRGFPWLWVGLGTVMLAIILFLLFRG
jgi:hypothetical protein